MQTNNLPRGRKPEWIVNLGKSFAGVAKVLDSGMRGDLAIANALRKTTLKLQTMKIERKGKVSWRVTGDTHCGPKALLVDGRIAVEYTVSVTCAPHLDKRGFLFDQAMVDLWMQRQAEMETSLSCEKLVITVAEKMLAKMAKDVPHCKVTELIMTLSPAPHSASVTARFGE
jgi:hypothetical protein